MAHNYNLGIFAALLEIFLSITIAILAKLLASDVSVFVILLYRYLFCLPILIFIGLFQRGRCLLLIDNWFILTARTTFGILGLATWFLALPLLGIIKTTVLAQLMAIFIAILAPVLLKEKIGIRGWTAIAFGLLGTLFILRPDLRGWWSYGIFFGLLTPLFAALMNISLRKLGDTDWPITTAIWYNSAGLIVFCLICYSQKYKILFNFDTSLTLVSVGLIASFQQFSLAISRAKTPAVILAPLSYLMVPLSIIFGIFIFQEQIDLFFLIGSIIILVSAFYTVRNVN